MLLVFYSTTVLVVPVRLSEDTGGNCDYFLWYKSSNLTINGRVKHIVGGVFPFFSF